MVYLIITLMIFLFFIAVMLENDQGSCKHNWVLKQEHNGEKVKLKWYKCSKCGEGKTKSWYWKEYR